MAAYIAFGIRQRQASQRQSHVLDLTTVRTHSNASIFFFLRIKNYVAFGIFAGNGNQENHAIN